MSFEYPWLKKELSFDGVGCRRGDKLPLVRKTQEWLTLQGLGVMVDGEFGPATEAALKAFQVKNSLPVDGVVNLETFTSLTAPLLRALKHLPAAATMGQMVVGYATQHLAERPREVGGQNRGPWVRLYMEGNEGKDWAWCAGFACFILRQAAKTLQTTLPVKPTFSCDELASRARSAGIFLSGLHLTDPVNQIAPGSIFLNRKSRTDWVHTGIVTVVHDETFETIEGNTNDAGEREGYEVCRRSRSYGAMDFIII